MAPFIRHFIKIFVLILGVSFAQSSNASHLLGADIEWECVGKDSFEVTLSVYRDCSGLSLDKPSLNFSCPPVSKTELSYVEGKDITNNCSQACTQCDSNSCQYNYGAEEHSVTWLVDFSGSNCSQVTFSYLNSSRNTNITTGPGGGDLYVEAWMDLNQAPCNNSPQFDRLPKVQFCKNQQTSYSQGIHSDDRDSLGNLKDSITVEFAQPLNGPGNPVSWDSDYDYDDPLVWQGKKTGLPRHFDLPYGFHFNSTTGDLRFTPVEEDITLLALQVNEYRDGSLVAYTKRDMTIFINDCPNNSAPNVASSDFGGSGYKEICAGESLTFQGTDPDNPSKGDSVTLDFKAGNLPKEVNWTDNNGQVKAPSGTLHFPETLVDSLPRTYTFFIRTKDDHCPINGSNSKSYRVKVNPNVDVNYSFNKEACGTYNFQVNSSNTSLNSVNWQGEGNLDADTQNFKHRFAQPGDYPFTLHVDNGKCQLSHQDTVHVDSFLFVDIGEDTTICRGSDISLQGAAKYTNGSVSYTWHDGVKGKQNRTFTNLKSDTSIWLTVTDDSCTYTDTVDVKVQARPEVNLGPEKGVCAGDTLTLSPKVKIDSSNQANPPWIYLADGNQNPQYDWYEEGVSIPFSQDSFLNVSDSGIYILKVTDSLGCNNSDTIEIVGNINLSATASKNQICEGDSVVLEASGGTGYKWYPDEELSCAACTNPVATPQTEKTYVVTEANSNSCNDTAQVRIDVKPRPNALTSSDQEICEGDSVALNASGGSSYMWNPSKGLNCTNCDSTVASPDTTIDYQVIVSEAGCKDTAQVQVKVNDDPNLTGSTDTLICKGSSITLNVSGASSYDWYPDSGLSCTNCQNPTASPDTTTTYWVEGTNAQGCIDTNQITVAIDNCTNITNASAVKDLQVYPNPNKGPFTIEFKAHSGKSVTTRVYDMNGKLVHENKLKGDNSVFSERINLNGQSEGIYHLEIKTGAEVIHKQIVIQE